MAKHGTSGHKPASKPTFTKHGGHMAVTKPKVKKKKKA